VKQRLDGTTDSSNPEVGIASKPKVRTAKTILGLNLAR
jgi:hypothetical protein